jgi:hypothetical protein
MIRNPIPWPNGAQCACAITFDVDADSLIHVAKPKDSFNRLYPITMGRYGPTVGVPRILDTYRRHGHGLWRRTAAPATNRGSNGQTLKAILERMRIQGLSEAIKQPLLRS